MQVPKKGGGVWASGMNKSRKGGYISLYRIGSPTTTTLGAAASRTVGTFITVGNTQKAGFFMIFLVEMTHQGTAKWNDTDNKEKWGLRSSETNSFPDQEVELTNCKIRRHQVLLFVQVSYPSFGNHFYHRNWSRYFSGIVSLSDACSLEEKLWPTRQHIKKAET